MNQADTRTLTICGKVIVFWTARRPAALQAKSLTAAFSRAYEPRSLTGHSDLWYVVSKGSRSDGIDASKRGISSGALSYFEDLAHWRLLADEYESEAGKEPNPFYAKHCTQWVRVDPLDLRWPGVEFERLGRREITALEREYGVWAAMTAQLAIEGATLEEVAQAIEDRYAYALGQDLPMRQARTIAGQFV